MKWIPGTRTIRAASLKLPPDYDLTARMAQSHVIELAKSIRENGGRPAQLPVVEWTTMELVCGGDRFAALCLNGMKLRGISPDLDGMLEVCAFEGTAGDIKRLRRAENIHRRQDRDRWLREQVEEEARELAVARGQVAVSERRGGEAGRLPDDSDDPSEAKGGGAHPGDSSGSPGNTALDSPEQFMCDIKTDGVTCGHPVGEDGKCENGHDWSPAAVFAGARIIGWTEVVEQQAGVPPRPLVTKADKTAARKKVAERTGTTPAAVKQAEQRDRQRKGETKHGRVKHDDAAGPVDVRALGENDLLQLYAYLDGFARGADHKSARKRHQVDPKTHEQWKRGYDDGRDAVRAVEERWRKSLGEARKGHGL